MIAKGKRPISTQRPYATLDMCYQNYYPALYVFEWSSMNVLNLENAQACAVDVNTISTNEYLFTIIIHSLIYKFTGTCVFIVYNLIKYLIIQITEHKKFIISIIFVMF